MRKKLSKQIYRFLHREFDEHRNRGIITQEQVDDMMTYYQEGYGLSFIRVVSTVGATLIGLGVILFIASNWEDMARWAKVLIILVGIGASFFTSYKLEKEYPKTSEAFLYLTVLVFGAGIFLIQQIFNISDPNLIAFLLWCVGALGVGYLFNKTLLFVFAQGLGLIYITANFDNNIIIVGLLLVAGFYYVNQFFRYKKLNTFITTGIALIYLLNVLFYFEVDGIYNAFIYLAIGLAMYYIKHDLNRDVFKLVGLINIGIGGFALSFKYLWEQLPFINNGNLFSISFGIIFIIYLLSLVEKRQIIPLIWTCVMIIRYYFDQLYDFLPKSLFFIIGGAIILGFAFYIERFRKGGFENEKLS